MNSYLVSQSLRMAGGKENNCEFGHGSHDVMTVNITAPFQRHMRVFNWMRYETPTPGYCTGRDEVSKGIQSAGWWELPAARIVADLLDAEPGPVVDFGAHVGWYGMLAEHRACAYLGIEADPERVDLMRMNAPCATTCRAWVGEDTTSMEPGPSVRLVKIDTDGSEAHVLRVVAPLFAQKLVDAVLIEVDGRDPSPAAALVEYGFIGWEITHDIAGTLVELVNGDPVVTADTPMGRFEGQKDVLFLR